MSSKNSGFTASDIERYHSGKMPVQERHALEKAALDDPFLADALEGYAFTQTPTADLAAILARLDEKPDTGKAIPFYKKYRWLSAAAAFVILAGSGWIAFKTFNLQKNDYAIAPKKEVQQEKTSSETPAVTAIPDSFINTTTLSKEASKKKRQTATKESVTDVESATPQNSMSEIQETSVVENKVLNEQRNNEVVVRSSNQSDLPTTRNQNASRSFNGGIIPNADRRDLNRNQAINVEPRINNADARQRESNDAAPVAGRVASVNTDTVRNLTIVLEPLKMDTAEVVIIGYGSQKKSEVVGSVSQKKSTERYPRVIIDTLEPAEGYVSFDDYIANNITMPEELKIKSTSGEVQLSFDVDKDGQPVNITVVKSLCQKCDEEAIRLLKGGPKWKKKNNKKGKITIRF